MKITKDSKNNVILNNGAYRVILSADLVQAIGEQVYAESPRGESEGRMVVVDLGEVAAGESEEIAYPGIGAALPVCDSCLVPAVLESVQGGGPEYGDEQDEPEQGYGAFPGGDPRLFDPDPECSTPEEREAHRKACQEADAMEARGEVPDEVPAHQWVVGKDAVIYVAAPGFGLGVYQIEAPSAAGRFKKPHERNSDFGDVLTVTLEGRNER